MGQQDIPLNSKGINQVMAAWKPSEGCRDWRESELSLVKDFLLVRSELLFKPGDSMTF